MFLVMGVSAWSFLRSRPGELHPLAQRTAEAFISKGDRIPADAEGSVRYAQVIVRFHDRHAVEVLRIGLLPVRQLGRRQQLGEGLSPAAVYDRVRHWAKVAGLTPEDFGSHSPRSGFMSTAARRGKDLDSIMRASLHKSERVARGCIQRETVHERGAGEGLL
jgi:hypothetical protein